MCYKRSVGFGGMDQVVWNFGGRGKALCHCACKEFLCRDYTGYRA